jgi:hypothetical protein
MAHFSRCATELSSACKGFPTSDNMRDVLSPSPNDLGGAMLDVWYLPCNDYDNLFLSTGDFAILSPPSHTIHRFISEVTS